MGVLLVDNHDSFTYNLFHLIGAVLGRPPHVVTNDGIDRDELLALAPDAVVISPGPGHPAVPRDVGISATVLADLDVPILGVCLGHQALAHLFGASVGLAPEPVHGRSSPIHHDGSDLFDGLPQGFCAVRYHSLAVLGGLPDELVVSAWTRDGIPMGLRHRTRPLRGVQFHPESICTEHGARLLSNFLTTVAGCRPACRHPGRPSSVPLRRSEVRVRRLCPPPDPETAFVTLFGDEPHAFWLDSSMGGPGGGRFSYMGDARGPGAKVIQYDGPSQTLTLTTATQTVVRCGPLFDFLAGELADERQPVPRLPFDFATGLVGYLGYELARDCGYPTAHRSELPDAALIKADRMLVFDSEADAAYLVADGKTAEAERWFDDIERRLDAAEDAPIARLCRDDGPITFTLRRGEREYLADIEACLQEIRAGESYELCLTNQLTTDPVACPLDLYRVLRRISPAPFSAFLRFGSVAVLSSSPELFLRAAADGVVISKPIKGTAARRASDEEDARARHDLATSEKDRAENLMIVDLLRNDLGRVCALGTVDVPVLMNVESYATVHQLVSTVRGHLRPDATLVDLVRACFPGGSMTGAPKRRTLEILDRLEPGARGVYSGCIGWLGADGAAQLNIVIRTAVVTPTRTSIGIGGAIVALSDPTAEFDETLLKAGALVRAIVTYRTGSYRSDCVVLVGVEDATKKGCFESQAPSPETACGPSAQVTSCSSSATLSASSAKEPTTK